MFVRTKKKIASNLSKTKSVQNLITGLLGEHGHAALMLYYELLLALIVRRHQDNESRYA